MGEKVSRRNYLKVLGGTVGGLVVGAAIGYLAAPGKVVEKTVERTVTQTVTATPTVTPIKTYAGISLRVPHMAGWLSQAPGIALVSEFEKETGMKIVYDMIPPADVASKQWLEVSNRTGNYDIVTVGVDRVHPRFLPYCIGLNKYIEEYYGSIKDFENKVFLEPQKSAFYEGEYRGIPIHLNSPFGVYRKQLFENSENQKKFESEYGYELRPPRTIQELEDIAIFFTKPPMYGLTGNLGGAPIPAGFVTFLDRFMSAGFDVLDKDFRPIFKYNDKAYELGVEIARWFQDGIYKKKFINPDAATFRAGTMADFYISGLAAMGIGWFGDFFGIRLQEKEVIDKIGESGDFVIPSFRPESEAGGFASWWMHGILDTCKYPDAAWEYIKWVASEKYQLACAAVQVPPFKDLAEKARKMPNPNNPKIPLLPDALYQAALKARVWFYIRDAGMNVPELCYEPWDEGLKLWGSLMANQITPEEFITKWSEVAEATLEKAGYYKK